ncbi:phage tail protein [Amycolatopsis sp. OK19-0408]|uniref:Phage tail protein n=1 Tax=Amycolatopsis iheyensis TaxID=2945988 RepID=A0A9X2SPS3_9PSEU|nr:phage tail protein [Amycolatopsis iheyensis]MCR6487825.1 phage tail protein [Amycolatopsis iheyensis]
MTQQLRANVARAVGVRPGADTKKPAERYGMTMWFNVIVPDLDGGGTSLGLWSGCSGLEVNFTPEGPLDEGGNYDSPRYLPGRITYKPLTLDRAMTVSGSTKVRQWLQRQAAEWRDGRGAEEDRPPITIQLFSGLSPGDELIHTWTLRNAIPVAWSVPTLSSGTGGGIAIEKLSFVHNGFLNATQSGPRIGGHRTGERARLRIAESTQPDAAVTFYCSPGKFTLSQARQVKLKDGQSINDGSKVVDDDALSVTLNDLLLEGTRAVKAGITTLKKWLQPLPGPPVSPGVPPAAPKEGTPPGSPESKRAEASFTPLTLSLGATVAYLPAKVVLKSITVNFTRFTPDGTPSRATVSLVLQEKT